MAPVRSAHPCRHSSRVTCTHCTLHCTLHHYAAAKIYSANLDIRGPRRLKQAPSRLKDSRGPCVPTRPMRTDAAPACRSRARQPLLSRLSARKRHSTGFLPGCVHLTCPLDGLLRIWPRAPLLHATVAALPRADIIASLTPIFFTRSSSAPPLQLCPPSCSPASSRARLLTHSPASSPCPFLLSSLLPEPSSSPRPGADRSTPDRTCHHRGHHGMHRKLRHGMHRELPAKRDVEDRARRPRLPPRQPRRARRARRRHGDRACVACSSPLIMAIACTLGAMLALASIHPQAAMMSFSTAILMGFSFRTLTAHAHLNARTHAHMQHSADCSLPHACHAQCSPLPRPLLALLSCCPQVLFSRDNSSPCVA